MRTVRKVARARNRPRRGLAWLIVLALIVLVLVATRATAAPLEDHEEPHAERRDRDELEDLAPDELALLDEALEELDTELDADDAIRLAGHVLDDPAAARDADERYRRPSRWGRFDVALVWRRHVTDDKRGDALWLLATWSR